ncbi:Transglutaminase-like superfamily protein [Granulicella pectinivorans]|uniref:Transglutaminase-like superfamily protein n=1 Tax=Granulicella pectinivorans TaxID=474950 RepID=A0A1I6M998_9BACT|nr:Transglutaminase-like superfamily protein [Granulicella pectinivorans]
MKGLRQRFRILFIRKRDLPLAMQASAWLFLAWLALDVLPGKLYLPMMRPDAREITLSDDDVQTYARRVRWSVRAAAKRVPWRAVCFHEGLAAHQMLSRAGISSLLHYGVDKTEGGGLEAHVWVTAGAWIVVGGEAYARFTEIATFGAKSK